MLDPLYIYQLCNSFPHCTEGFPFGGNTLVFKVGQKMYAAYDIEKPVSINLKCQPNQVIELQESNPDTVLPAYHMNKKHWITLQLNTQKGIELFKPLLTQSYGLVFNSLSKNQQIALATK